MIAGQKKELLQHLRDGKFPSILDAIIQLEMDKRLSDFLIIGRAAIESISDEYGIIIYRDLENPNPKSKFDVIPAKELVCELFFAEFASRYEVLIGEFREKLTALLVEISNIDEVVEFALETAFDLLRTNRENTDIIAEACNTITEGFERADRKIDELMTQCKAISDKFCDSLHAASTEFNEKLYGLIKIDESKLTDYKHQLAQVRTKEKLSQYQEKAGESFDAASRSVFGFFKNINRR